MSIPIGKTQENEKQEQSNQSDSKAKLIAKGIVKCQLQTPYKEAYYWHDQWKCNPDKSNKVNLKVR